MKNFRYLTGCLDEVIEPLVMKLSKINGYVKTFKDKGEDNNKNNQLMSFRIDDDELLEKYITFWTKIEDLLN